MPLKGRSPFAIPPALDALLMECLAKDPDRRPESAVVLSERLAAAIAPAAWTPEAARVWWDCHQPLTPSRDDGISCQRNPQAPMSFVFAHVPSDGKRDQAKYHLNVTGLSRV